MLFDELKFNLKHLFLETTLQINPFLKIAQNCVLKNDQSRTEILNQTYYVFILVK